jgi:hypothetical protein
LQNIQKNSSEKKKGVLSLIFYVVLVQRISHNVLFFPIFIIKNTYEKMTRLKKDGKNVPPAATAATNAAAITIPIIVAALKEVKGV